MEKNRMLNDPKTLFINAEGFGEGSGFFVKEDLIVTNIHVVAGATSISAKVVDTNGNTIKSFNVEGVKSFDAKNDLVILKIAGEGTPHPIGNSNLVQSGDIVRALGYPNGVYKVTEGPIHSIRSSDKWIRMKFKTDRGNSGGPVLNRSDEVIGIAATSSDCFSFAVSVNAMKVLFTQGQEMEPVARWHQRKQIRAYTCMVQSEIKCKAGNYNEAIANLDKAIQLNPDNVRPWFRRGVVKSGFSQSKSEEGNVVETQQYYQDAIGDYTEAIRLCVDFAAAYNNRANTKRLLGISEVRLGSVEAAKDLYQAALIDVNTAIELDSDVALFHHTRGEIMHALGDYKIAIEDYERSQEIDPNYTDVCKDLELTKKALEQQKTL